jgi:methylthioribose-1-phosphate isomerase
VEPFKLVGDHLEVLDQRFLPEREVWIKVHNGFEGARVIKEMAIRGAPIIAVFSAYCLYIHSLREPESLMQAWEALRNSRPTGVNLHKILDEVRPIIENGGKPEDLYNFAREVERREREINEKIAKYGLLLFDRKKRVLTYCNTGSLATVGLGTALGIIKLAHRNGLIEEVYVGETSPYLQGARLTAYELRLEGIPYKVVPDNHIPFLISRGMVDIAIVGADRITKDLFVFNKIGTLSIALACRYYKVPFVVAAPSTTFDENPYSDKIEIEKRQDIPREDYLYFAFDITPPDLVDFIISDKGIRKVS